MNNIPTNPKIGEVFRDKNSGAVFLLTGGHITGHFSLCSLALIKGGGSHRVIGGCTKTIRVKGIGSLSPEEVVSLFKNSINPHQDWERVTMKVKESQ